MYLTRADNALRLIGKSNVLEKMHLLTPLMPKRLEVIGIEFSSVNFTLTSPSSSDKCLLYR